MRRAVLACAIAVGLVAGMARSTSAIGLTQVTLSCDDGTTSTTVVDTDTLTGLTQSVQAMIDYPAGLTCALAQVPVPGIVRIGGLALASPGQSPFIVGGGRWLVPCAVIFPDFCPGGICAALPAPVVARAPGGQMSLRPLNPTSAQTGDTIWVNIAVNFHQRDDLSFYGTLNETIPANQFCGTRPVGETHFTSKPEASTTGCFMRDPGDPTKAYTTSRVTQTSGQQRFPNGFGGFLTENVSDVQFSFIDNGNPGQQAPGVNDMLKGPPAPGDSTCDPPFQGIAPYYDLVHGNITLHPKP